MSPEQLRQFNQMQEDLRKIKEVRDVSFIAEMSRRLSGSRLTIQTGSTTGTTIAVRNATDTGSEVVANEYDGVIELVDGAGNIYRIGYYN